MDRAYVSFNIWHVGLENAYSLRWYHFTQLAARVLYTWTSKVIINNSCRLCMYMGCRASEWCVVADGADRQWDWRSPCHSSTIRQAPVSTGTSVRVIECRRNVKLKISVAILKKSEASMAFSAKLVEDECHSHDVHSTCSLNCCYADAENARHCVSFYSG